MLKRCLCVLRRPNTMQGGESRFVPIFPEVKKYLLEALEQRKEGETFVITRTRSTATNLRTQMQRIIRKAGLEVWPKLWQNLRSTRETELVETFPEHKVVKWIGHSSAVARKFYLQMKDEDFKHAASGGDSPPKQAAQNAAQYGAEMVCNDVKPEAKNTGFTGIYGGLPLSTLLLMGDKGFEPLTPSV